MLKPVDLLHVQDSDAAVTPSQADFQQAAQELAPLIDRVANGEDLTLRQLADIGLNGWRLLDGLLNTPYHTEVG
ncbi:hypothetical protein [Virgisporangium aurantiacum]|uniref:Uncharacterized protein n=1 Tax=Virgisporangium aurantiacum TaxID=175570 RepID=A0A8J3Z5W2_9ACTN|nr:hypothetical protein [Virgisporangium aurantiacum]GIJ58054.1 hypothetical protein Vau01_055700 [Virgisporangium aurantiacum]